MADIRPANVLTRRTLMFAGAAAPLLAQGEKAAPHPVVHFEIGCTDRARTEQFFSSLFGWKTQAAGPAANIDTAGGGIPGHITALGHEPQHYTIFYIEVENVKAYLDKAVTLGGKILVPPVKIPTGTFAWFADPDGNTIGLLKPAA